MAGILVFHSPNAKTPLVDFGGLTGYVFTLYGGEITWKSSRHSIVAMSTTKLKYVVDSKVAMEAAWMKKFC